MCQAYLPNEMISPRIQTMYDVVVNPATGSGRGIKTYEMLKPFLESAGISYQVHFSGTGRSIKSIVHDITSERGADIIIIGGDGSMNEAVNGIADFENTRIAFIPSGSGNDLAKALKIPVISKRIKPSRIRKLVSRIAKGKRERLIDLGICETEGKKSLFIISSGIGFDAESCFLADRSHLKQILNRLGAGKLVYILVAIRLILKNERSVCRIKTPDGKIRKYEKCLFAVVMNHCYEGGGFMFCPEADDSDGKLDVCVVDNVTPLKFMKMFPKALSGKHVKYSEIDVFQCESLEITMSKPRYLHTDGEASEKNSFVRFSVSPFKLRLI